MRHFLVLLLPLLAAGCPTGDPVERLVSQLDNDAHREQAIDRLLVLVKQAPEARRDRTRERVVHALMEAYRRDSARPQIVTTLALLRDPRAEEVFVAAVKDAPRGGAYFEAAVRSARIIGELRLRRSARELIGVLDRALKAPRQDRNTWLQRSVIEALERLGDRAAVPVLIRALRADPAHLDFYVNRLAARALGELRDPRAIRPLIAALGATRHGLLLFEEGRRALCRIGAAAVEPLFATAARRNRRSRPAPNSAAALAVLGDLAEPALADRLSGLARPGDPPQFQLALTRALLRLTPDGEGQATAIRVLADPRADISSRRLAADIAGWYGAGAIAARLRPACQEPGPAGKLLCWSVARAYSRTSDDLTPLDRLAASTHDKATLRNLQVYRRRLVARDKCRDDLKCHEETLTREKDWRKRERAALELGRIQAPDPAPIARALAGRVGTEHPEVRRAILISLERLLPRLFDLSAIRRLLERPSDEDKSHGPTPPDLVSRAICFQQRLTRGRKKDEQ